MDVEGGGGTWVVLEMSFYGRARLKSWLFVTFASSSSSSSSSTTTTTSNAPASSGGIRKAKYRQRGISNAGQVDRLAR